MSIRRRWVIHFVVTYTHWHGPLQFNQCVLSDISNIIKFLNAAAFVHWEVSQVWLSWHSAFKPEDVTSIDLGLGMSRDRFGLLEPWVTNICCSLASDKEHLIQLTLVHRVLDSAPNRVNQNSQSKVPHQFVDQDSKPLPLIVHVSCHLLQPSQGIQRSKAGILWDLCSWVGGLLSSFVNLPQSRTNAERWKHLKAPWSWYCRPALNCYSL